MPSLADKCAEFLQENLDPSNVFSILPYAQKYEEKTLIDRCWKVIDAQTEMALKSDGLETIDVSLLEELVARDTLTITEVVLFQAVDRWATKQCEKEGLAADGQTKRRILCKEVIKAIRFPVMTAQEFADVVLGTSILHQEEVTSLFTSFNSALPSPLAFSNTLRQSSVLCDIHRCGRRFQSVNGTGWGYTKQRKDRLAFVVNRDITLHGVSLFGSENNSYTVTLEVKDTTNNTTIVSKSGTYPSKLFAYKSDLSVSYYGFEVLFDSAASLKMSTCYVIEALICGPSSEAGRNGIVTVTQSGVTFTFAPAVTAESNGTQVGVQ